MDISDPAELLAGEGTEEGPLQEEAPARMLQFVAAQYGEQALAVPLTHVRRVIRDARISLLPAAHPALPGLAAVDGRLLAVLDIGPLVGETSLPVDVPHWGLWVTDHDAEALLLVSRVLGLHEVPEEHIASAEEGIWHGKYPWPLEAPQEMVYILDIRGLFALAARVYG